MLSIDIVVKAACKAWHARRAISHSQRVELTYQALFVARLLYVQYGPCGVQLEIVLWDQIKIDVV